MKAIILLLFNFIYFTGISQSKGDTSIVFTKVTDYVKMLPEGKKFSHDFVLITPDSRIFVYGHIKTSSIRTDTAKVFYNGVYYLCLLEDLLKYIPQKDIDAMKGWTIQWEPQRRIKAEYASNLLFELEKKIERQKYLNSILQVDDAFNQGFVFIWDWSEGGYSLKTQSFSFKVINAHKKKIKYTWVTISIYNPVEDFISKKTLTLIGPIENNESGKYDFDNVFYSNVAKTAKVNSIKVQYFDGTAKTFTGSALTKVIVTEEAYLNYLNYLEKEGKEK